MIAWRYAAATDVGLLRDGNEDAAFAGTRLLAVADGMGGHAAGEVASAAVIAALEQLDELGVNAGDPQHALREAVEEANVVLRDMVAADSELQGMGTTVTAVLTDGEYAWLAHVGDSRAYLLREGTLQQLTRDHTFVQQLVDEGRITAQAAMSHPQRNYITRALDGREGIELDLERLDLLPGDRLLLCSDGLSGVVTDETIATVLDGSTPDQAVHQLVDLALRAGGPDNVTCIVADAVDATPQATDDDAAVLGAAADEPQTHTQTQTRTSDDGPDPRDRARRIRRRRAAALLVFTLALLTVAATAGYRWTQRQYYVGTSGDQVAIYQGVEGTLAGLDLSHVEETTQVAVADLADHERKRVEDGIQAGSLAEAREIVSRMQVAP
jgi:protein phosphatase